MVVFRVFSGISFRRRKESGYDFTVSTLVSGSLISKIGANSIVNLNGKIWCGSPMGVYCFDLQTQDETWYPMDYARYIE